MRRPLALEKVPSGDPLVSAFDRAFMLAESGNYPDWPGVAEQLAREGYRPSVISGFGRDRSLKRALVAVILEATKRLEADARVRKSPTRMSPALPVWALGRRKA
jgi:hypothetical protein